MSAPVQAYPLAWPAGWKRTPAQQRRSGNFAKGERQYSNDGQRSWQGYTAISVADAIARVLAELGRMRIGREDIVISTNLRTRLDGLPRSDQRAPEDPGAAVYWETKTGERRCMAVDRYERVEHNLAAIAATLEALRAIERHGGAAILDRAFTGFTALPPPVAAQRPWRQVFGFAEDEEVSPLRLEGAYRTARGEAHPDRPGGSHEAFLAVQAAYAAGMRELGNPA